jgi:putative tricarboxylic transport membrane protein
MYGGAISSITLGIPGASTAVATTFDGRPLAMQGRASLALVTAAVASFIGGTVSNIFFTAFAPPLASVALSFGPPEIFALMLLAFATFVGLGGDDIPKTIFSICIGLVLASVGYDEISGAPRLIFFDITGFLHGINFLVLAIGVYGIGEMLWTIDSTRGKITSTTAKFSVKGVVDDAKEGMRRGWKGTAIGSFIGFFVGILPAAGATPGSLMSYGVSKMLAKDSKEYGKGHPDGVAAPEAANNSASTGSMLPMLTLGIPGSPTTAILLGGMVIWGLTPGPRLFVDQSEFVWGLIGSFYVSNFFALIVNIAFIPVFIWMLAHAVHHPGADDLRVIGRRRLRSNPRHARRMAHADLRHRCFLPAQARLSSGTSRAGHRAWSDRRADIAPVAAAVVRRPDRSS